MRFVGIILSLMMFGACVNDLEKIHKITVKNNDPNERVQDLQLVFTDSGYAKVRVFATIAETYYEPKNVTKLKDSLCVYFFDSKGKIETILTGKYGEYYPNEGKMFVRNQVVLLKPALDQKMETEELIWTQADSSIFSQRAVTVTTPDGKFFGDGVKSKQDFSYYEFLKPRGKIIKD